MFVPCTALRPYQRQGNPIQCVAGLHERLDVSLQAGSTHYFKPLCGANGMKNKCRQSTWMTALHRAFIRMAPQCTIMASQISRLGSCVNSMRSISRPAAQIKRSLTILNSVRDQGVDRQDELLDNKSRDLRHCKLSTDNNQPLCSCEHFSRLCSRELGIGPRIWER
jgi:hypothetical protein